MQTNSLSQICLKFTLVKCWSIFEFSYEHWIIDLIMVYTGLIMIYILDQFMRPWMRKLCIWVLNWAAILKVWFIIWPLDLKG